MKFLLSLLVGVAFVGGLVTDGVAGGDKSGASASGTVSGSSDASASPSTAGQDKTSGQDKATGGRDKTSGTTSTDTPVGTGGSASPATGGQDKGGAAGTLSAPTNKDECKDDGWQKFGFKNQGECVSSITSNSEKKQ